MGKNLTNATSPLRPQIVVRLTVLITTILFLQGCHFITPVEMTNTAIGETFYRIHLYMRSLGNVPQSLEVLPIRENYANRTTDGWGRELLHTVSREGIITLQSLGRDGEPGGEGEDADISRSYRTIDETGKSIIGDDYWIVNAEINIEPPPLASPPSPTPGRSKEMITEHSEPTRGIVLVPEGEISKSLAPELVESIKKYHGIDAQVANATDFDNGYQIRGKRQYNSDRIIRYGENLSSMMDGNPFVIVLTDKDINSPDSNVRFWFFSATEGAMVVSLARMGDNRKGWLMERATKAVNRGIGGSIYKLPRTSSKDSVMFAPIKSVQDLDAMEVWYDEAGPAPRTAIAPIPKILDE